MMPSTSSDCCLSDDELGKRDVPGDDDKEMGMLSEEDSKKTKLTAAAAGYNA